MELPGPIECSQCSPRARIYSDRVKNPRAVIDITNWLKSGLDAAKSMLRNPGRLTRQVMGLFGVKVVGSILGFLMSIALARVLGDDSYGEYAFVFSLVAFALPFALLGLSQLLTREVAAAYATRDWGIVQGLLIRPRRLVAASVVVVSVVGLAVVGAVDWENPIDLTIYVFASIAMLFIAQESVISGQLKGLLEVTTASLPRTVVRPLVLLIALLVANAVWSTVSASAAMALHSLAAIVAMVVGLLFLRGAVRRKVEAAEPTYLTRKWLVAGVPFMLYEGLYAAGTQLPVIILGLAQPDEAVGWFRVAVSFSALTQFFLGLLGAVVQPEFARLHALGDRSELQRLTTKVIRVGLLMTVPVATVFIGLGLPLLEWFYGADYASAYPALVVLVLAQLVSVALGPVGILLTMTHNERYAVQALVLYALVAAVGTIVLAPQLGALGAGIAHGLSILALEVTMAVRVSQRLSISLSPWPSTRQSGGSR